MKTYFKCLILFGLLFTSCTKMNFSGPENVWLESLESQKLKPTDVIAFKSGMEELQTRDAEIDLTLFPNALWAVKAGKYILSTGLYSQGRYQLFDKETGKSKYFLDYPKHPQWPDINEETQSIMFASNVLKVRPDNKAFVCADMYSGIMEICSIRDGEIFSVKQLCYHYPKVRIQKQKSSKTPVVAYSRDNLFGFTDVFTTQDRIFAVYSGKTYRQDKRNVFEGSFLMVFDWNGNLLKSFELSVPLTLLKYNEEEKAIFGQRFRENYLIKYLLP